MPLSLYLQPKAFNPRVPQFLLTKSVLAENRHDDVHALICVVLFAAVSDRTQAGQRQSIQEQNYTFHVYCTPDAGDLCAVMVTDDEYPVRVAFSLLNKLTDEFQEVHPKASYSASVDASRSSASSPKFQEIQWATLKSYLDKYQDPKQADTIMRVQQELDETKIVLVRVALL